MNWTSTKKKVTYTWIIIFEKSKSCILTRRYRIKEKEESRKKK